MTDPHDCTTCRYQVQHFRWDYTRCSHPSLQGPDLVFAVLLNPHQCGPSRAWYERNPALPKYEETPNVENSGDSGAPCSSDP